MSELHLLGKATQGRWISLCLGIKEALTYTCTFVLLDLIALSICGQASLLVVPSGEVLLSSGY